MALLTLGVNDENNVGAVVRMGTEPIQNNLTDKKICR